MSTLRGALCGGAFVAYMFLTFQTTGPNNQYLCCGYLLGLIIGFCCGYGIAIREE
jgi:hypothetical protein